MAHTDLIAGYLLDLNRHLRGFWPRRRQILDEVKDHLCEAAMRAELSGLSEQEAGRQALAHFGAPGEVALRFAEERMRSASKRALKWVVVPMAATVALTALGDRFPVHPSFHGGEVPSPVLQMQQVSHLLVWLAPLILIAAAALHRRSWSASYRLTVAAACISGYGALGSCLSMQFISVATLGDSSRTYSRLTLWLLFALLLATFSAAFAGGALEAARKANRPLA